MLQHRENSTGKPMPMKLCVHSRKLNPLEIHRLLFEEFLHLQRRPLAGRVCTIRNLLTLPDLSQLNQCLRRSLN